MNEKKSVGLRITGLALIGAMSCTDAGVKYLTHVSDEAAGENCADGGQKLDFGADADSDGTLASNEVTASAFVCNGAASRGALVTTATLPAGDAHCPSGGFALSVGIDLNSNGVVDADEGTTRFVCSGPAGEQGVAGPPGVEADGRASLVQVTGISADGACPGTGIRVSYGMDQDGNGVLNAKEGKSVDVCDGAAGPSGAAGVPTLFLLTPVFGAPPPCTNGGILVLFGPDTNRDGVLDTENEVTGQQLLCSGSNGTDGAPGPQGPPGPGIILPPAFVLLGAPCMVDANCLSANCSPLLGQCVQGTRAAGGLCFDDSQCASTSCDRVITNMCTAALSPLDTPCTQDSECVSDACADFPPLCIEGSRAQGLFCSDDTQCAFDCGPVIPGPPGFNRLCTGEPLRGLSSACSSNTQCLSDNCNQAVLSCLEGTRPPGALCTDDTQCAFDCAAVAGGGGIRLCTVDPLGAIGALCGTNGECHSSNCGAGGQCIEGTLIAGSICNDDTQCAFDCSGSLCTAAIPGPLGTACTVNAECLSDNCQPTAGVSSCAENNRPDGDACTDNTQCANDCESGLCVTPPAAFVGQLCDADTDCISGVCDTSRAACAEGTRADGLACTDDSQCSNACVGGFCGLVALGATCNISADCTSATCQNGITGPVCVQGVSANGTACTDNTQCSSSNCDTLTSQECVAAPLTALGQACTTSAECLSANCVGAVCAEGASPAGTTCSDDTQCAGNCSLDVSQCTLGNLGDACSTGADCFSSVCGPIGNTCVHDNRGTGAACTHSDQCNSDFCTAGGTCSA